MGHKNGECSHIGIFLHSACRSKSSVAQFCGDPDNGKSEGSSQFVGPSCIKHLLKTKNAS